MKTKTLLSSLFLLIVTSSISAFSQDSNFAGEWKLNKEKTVVPTDQLVFSGVKIQIKSDSLFTTRTYESPDGQEYTFDENLPLDGKENKISIYDMPRVSKVTKSTTDGSLIVESTTTFNGQYGEDNLIAKETWKVDNEGKVLTIDFTNKMSGNETTGINIYNKVEVKN
jgi:hypothetical protein